MIKPAYVQHSVSHHYLLYRRATICAKTVSTYLEASTLDVLYAIYWERGRKVVEGETDKEKVEKK